MSAILCIVGPITIMIGIVPMSFANMAIYLNIILLDKKQAVKSTAIYLLIGFTGIPVFSGFSGGAGKLFGPTGGYLIGYLFLCWIAGTILEKMKDEKRNFKQIWALGIGTIGVYFFGTVWLMYQSNFTFVEAFSVGVFPFLIPDFIKIVAAVGLGDAIKKRMHSAL